MIESGLVKAKGIFLKGEIESISEPQGGQFLLPLFEAISNSLEAIKLKLGAQEDLSSEQIDIRLKFNDTLVPGEKELWEINVIDTGIGLEQQEFDRLITLRDNRKGIGNKGTGRVQYLHMFEYSYLNSDFKNSESATGFSNLKVSMSKNDEFLNENAFIRVDEMVDIDVDKSQTLLILRNVINEKFKPKWNQLTLADTKLRIIEHFLPSFCKLNENLPQITITFEHNLGEETVAISNEDIPQANSIDTVQVPYRIIQDGELVEGSESEELTVTSFKLDKKRLKKNGLSLVAKNEIISSMDLDSIRADDDFEGFHYLVLISGEYFDQLASDSRNSVKLPNARDLEEYAGDIFGAPKLLISEDIQAAIHHVIEEKYPEIHSSKDEQVQQVGELQQMFLIDEETAKHVAQHIKVGWSDEQILNEVYKTESKKIAKIDATLKKQLETLRSNASDSKGFKAELNKASKSISKLITSQNKDVISNIIQRRTKNLELMDKVIKKELSTEAI